MPKDQTNDVLDSLGKRAPYAMAQGSPLLLNLERGCEKLYPRAMREVRGKVYLIVSTEPPAGGISSVPEYHPEARADFVVEINTDNYPWEWHVLCFRHAYFLNTTGVKDSYAPPYAFVRTTPRTVEQ